MNILIYSVKLLVIVIPFVLLLTLGVYGLFGSEINNKDELTNKRIQQ
ncbi:hypothetical protein [uncultured Maribacter sp.]|nr:hypothetical protein [uncultured Maribacter sp.]